MDKPIATKLDLERYCEGEKEPAAPSSADDAGTFVFLRKPPPPTTMHD